LRDILITGATGQIGSVCVRQLNARGITPVVLLRRPLPPGAWQGCQVRPVEGSLETVADRSLTEALGRTRVLFHLAARVNLTGRGASEMERVNVEGSERLFAAAQAAGVRRFVHVSTIGAVGCSDHREDLLNEDAVFNLARFGNPYFETKHRAEERLLAAWRAHPDPTQLVIVSPSITLGPPGSFRRLARVKRRRRPPRPGSPAYKLVVFWFDGGINLVDVRDAAAGILAAGERGTPGCRYILAGENLTIRSLMDHLREVFGTAGPRIRIPRSILTGSGRIAESWAAVTGRRARWNRSLARLAGSYWFYDASRAERDLGFRARPIRETLEDLRAWIDSLHHDEP